MQVKSVKCVYTAIATDFYVLNDSTAVINCDNVQQHVNKL